MIYANITHYFLKISSNFKTSYTLIKKQIIADILFEYRKLYRKRKKYVFYTRFCPGFKKATTKDEIGFIIKKHEKF